MKIMMQLKKGSRAFLRQNNNDEQENRYGGNQKWESNVSQNVSTIKKNPPIQGELCDACKGSVADGTLSHSVVRKLSQVTLRSKKNVKFPMGDGIQCREKITESKSDAFICKQCGQFYTRDVHLTSNLSFTTSKTRSILDLKNENPLQTDFHSSKTKLTLSSDCFHQAITENSSFNLSENKISEKLQQKSKNEASGLFHFPSAIQDKSEFSKVEIPKKEISNLKTLNNDLNRSVKCSSADSKLSIDDISNEPSASKLEIVKDIVSKLKKDILFIVNFDNGYSKSNCIVDKIDLLEKQLRHLFYLKESLMNNSIFVDLLSIKHKELNKLLNALREDVFQAYLKLSPGEKYDVARQGAQMGCIFTMLGVLEREICGIFKDMKILISKKSSTKVKKLKSHHKFTKSLPVLKISDSDSGNFNKSSDLMSKLVQPSPSVSINTFVTAETAPNQEMSNEMIDLSVLSSLVKQYFASKGEKAARNVLKNIKQKISHYKSKGYVIHFLSNHAVIETPQNSTYIIPIENAKFESNMNSVELGNFNFYSKDSSSLENYNVSLSLYNHLSNPNVSNLNNKYLSILKETLCGQGCSSEEAQNSQRGTKVAEKKKIPTLNSNCSEKDCCMEKTKRCEGFKTCCTKKPSISSHLLHEFSVCSKTSLFSSVHSDSFVSLSSDSSDFNGVSTTSSSLKSCSTAAYHSKSDLLASEKPIPSELVFENHFTGYYQDGAGRKLNLKNRHVTFESTKKLASL